MLPKNEKTFYISIVGETSQERYEGTFTCVPIATIAIKNAIERDEIREAGDLNNITVNLYKRARWQAHARNRLISWPEWWDGCRQGSDLIDDNVLKEIFDKIIEAEVEWREAVKKKAESTKEPSTTPGS
jgi:hypothetical protein